MNRMALPLCRKASRAQCISKFSTSATLAPSKKFSRTEPGTQSNLASQSEGRTRTHTHTLFSIFISGDFYFSYCCRYKRHRKLNIRNCIKKFILLRDRDGSRIFSRGGAFSKKILKLFRPVFRSINLVSRALPKQNEDHGVFLGKFCTPKAKAKF